MTSESAIRVASLKVEGIKALGLNIGTGYLINTYIS